MENNQYFGPKISEKRRIQQRENMRKARLRDKGLMGEPSQCRLCLAIQIPGIKFTSTRTKEISEPLQKMYGIDVGKGRITKFDRICPTCKTKLADCYKFYAQVMSTEAYLAEFCESEQEKSKNNENGPEILEYTEDHTMIVGDTIEILDEDIVETVNDETNVDTDLDFDFTDEEKEEDDVEEEEEEEEEEEATEEAPSHTKVVNQILDSGINGIESEIDCCLIDKTALAKTNEEQSGDVEEMTVIIDNDPSVSKTKRRRMSKQEKLPANNSSETSNGSEYIVCKKCMTIYPRQKGSNVTKCRTCLNKVQQETTKNREL